MKIFARSLSVLMVALSVSSLAFAGDYSWPTWRGADRTDVSQETGLLKEWPADGPQQLWVNKDVGLGYSGFAVVGSKLFTMGAREESEFLFCLDVNDGKELWATKIGNRLDNGWGDGPRGTPTVDGDAVFTMGGTGELVCASAENGEIRWQKSMSSLGGKKPGWGFCESLLVDGDNVVCTPGGGDGAIVALKKSDGEIVWQSKEVTDKAQYASVVPVELNGQRQYLQLFQDALVGVAAADGKLLWKTEWPGKTAVIPTPVYHNGYVFITSGYGVGCKLVRVGADNKVEDVYFNKNMKNHHGGVVRIGEHIYGHSDGVGWMCLDFKTGEIVWNEKSKLGKGSVTCADGMLYCVDERDGTVNLVEANPEGWKEHGHFKLSPLSERRSQKGKVWTHPVVCNGKLFLRDQEILSCYNVKAQ